MSGRTLAKPQCHPKNWDEDRVARDRQNRVGSDVLNLLPRWQGNVFANFTHSYWLSNFIWQVTGVDILSHHDPFCHFVDHLKPHLPAITDKGYR